MFATPTTDTEDMPTTATAIINDLGPSIMDMDDDEFEAYAATIEATAPRIPVGRDRHGRFTRRVNIEAVDVWVNLADGTSHAPTCGTIRGTKRRTPPAIVSTGARDGWACEGCTWVDTRNPWIEDRDNAPTSGNQTCVTCDRDMPVTKFPTIVICGFRMRAVACRTCETAARAARVPFDNFAMTYDRVVWDADHHDASARKWDARTAHVGPLHGPVMPIGFRTAA